MESAYTQELNANLFSAQDTIARLQQTLFNTESALTAERELTSAQAGQLLEAENKHNQIEARAQWLQTEWDAAEKN